MRIQKFPSEIFDQVYGTQLSYKWIMPDGLDEHQVADQISTTIDSMERENREMKPEEGYLIVKILEKNPELVPVLMQEALNNNELGMYHIIMGVISRFNLDDIIFFTQVWYLAVRTGDRRADEYRVGINILNKAATKNDGLGWIPSPKTMKQMGEILGVNVESVVNVWNDMVPKVYGDTHNM